MAVSPAKSKVIWITCLLWRGQSLSAPGGGGVPTVAILATEPTC